jgi:adenosylcobinamide-GDP ribazoletransferase
MSSRPGWWLRFLGAVQFLTVIPIARSTAPVHEAAVFFPLVGAGIGLLSAWPLLVTGLPPGLVAALVLVLQLGLTGMLHEDGLADIADGVRKGRPVERMLEIIRDSRIGAYGTCALVLVLLLRWQALAAGVTVWAVVSSEGLSRCVLLWLGHFTPAVRPGLGAYLSENRSWGVLVWSGVAAVGLAYPAGAYAPLLLGSLVGLTVVARAYFVARLGGVVGDCFGALQQAAVVVGLVVYQWPKS